MASHRVLAAAGATVMLWASAFVAVRVALDGFSPGQLALARYAVAAIVFLILAARRPMVWPSARDLPRLALVGGFGIALYNFALNTGQQTVSPGLASLLVNTVPVWTSLLAMLLLGERISARGWLGTAIAFLGVSIIGLHRGGWAGFDSGVVMVLVAALAQAVYFILSKPLLKRFSPLELTAWAVWFGCLFLIPFHVGLADALRHSSPATLGAVVFLGIGPAALGYLAWSYVLSEVPAGQASNALFLVPVVAIFLGWLVLGDMPALPALMGGGLAVIGVALGKAPWRVIAAPPGSVGGSP